MKRVVLMGVFIFVAIFAWRVGERVSADAISMAIGILLGTLASIPAAILVLAATRRSEQRSRNNPPAPQGWHGGQQGNAPVIVLSPPMMSMPPNQALPQANYAGWSTPPAEPVTHKQRRFRVVGEEDGWLDSE